MPLCDWSINPYAYRECSCRECRQQREAEEKAEVTSNEPQVPDDIMESILLEQSRIQFKEAKEKLRRILQDELNKLEEQIKLLASRKAEVQTELNSL